MSDNRSLIAYDYWKDSSQRFDYFVTALIGALVAFIAQSFVPTKLGMNPSTLEFISLLVLISSLICAFKRIEASTEAFRLMSTKLDAVETLEAMYDAQSKSQLFRDIRSGEVFDTNAVAKKIEKSQAIIKAAGEASAKFGKKAGTLYKWRNILMFTGFVLLILSRLLKAYIVAS